jgi:FMN phosphatase YigB (HAD superfamily)
MRVLAVDVDSTIWDFSPVMHDALREVCGVECDYEQVADWQHWFTLTDKENVYKAFSLALDPEKVKEREMYPGVDEALKEIHDQGVRIHFVTNNHDPEPMRNALAYWLLDNLSVPFGLTVLKDSKFPVLKRVGAFGVIDDRPDFIESAADKGYWVATKLHPWNREVVKKREDIGFFDDWREVPGMIEEALI